MTCHEIWMNFASFYWVKNDSPRFTNTEWRDSCSYFVHTLEAQKQISKSLWKTCAESSLPWEAFLFPHFPQPTHSPQASPGINSSTACDGALASGWAVGGVVGIGTCYFQPCRRTQQTSGWDISIGSYPKLCNRLWLWIMKFNASPLFIKIWISFFSHMLRRNLCMQAGFGAHPRTKHAGCRRSGGRPLWTRSKMLVLSRVIPGTLNSGTPSW